MRRLPASVRILAGLAAVALATPAARASAQSTQPARPDSSAAQDTTARAPIDTTHVHVLESVVVTAEHDKKGLAGVMQRLDRRARYTDLTREDAHLSNQLRAYDARVEVLETRLAMDKVKADSLSYDIAAIDSARATYHAERLRLEARLRAREAQLAAANPASASQTSPR